MKKLTVAFMVLGLMFTGAAFAADSHPKHSQADCVCKAQTQKSDGDGSVFKPLFPEYEIQPPMGG